LVVGGLYLPLWSTDHPQVGMLLIDEITLQGGYDVTIVKVAGSTCTISCSSV